VQAFASGNSSNKSLLQNEKKSDTIVYDLWYCKELGSVVFRNLFNLREDFEAKKI